MDQKLKDAAQVGDINMLYAFIREYPNLLEDIDKKSFVDTPLHIAASAGCTSFAIEVMRLKPSFGRKLNQDGFSPMHLALQQNQNETVRRLIKFDSELIRVQGKEGITPLHYVAETDDRDLLAEFLWACPASIMDLTIRCQTAAHIAVKNKSVKAFKVILGWLKRALKEEVLNWMDEDGNNVLHIAAYTSQVQVVKLASQIVRTNATNSMGFTAMDLALQLQAQHNPIENQRTENRRDRVRVIDILRRAKAFKSSSLHKLTSRADFLSSEERVDERFLRVFFTGRKEMSIEKRNLILVVAVLVATAAYQASLSPPGGVWQASDGNPTSTSTVSVAVSAAKNNTQKGHVENYAGKVVMSTSLFNRFLASNTIAFTMGMGVILLMLEIRDSTVLLHISLLCLMLSYFISIYVLSPPNLLTGFFTYGAWCVFCFIFFCKICGHTEIALLHIKCLAGLHPNHQLQERPFRWIFKPAERYWMLRELVVESL